MSRLEQVPSLPADYGLQKLLGGAGGEMEPPNDTSSVANMSVMTVTGENYLSFWNKDKCEITKIVF